MWGYRTSWIPVKSFWCIIIYSWFPLSCVVHHYGREMDPDMRLSSCFEFAITKDSFLLIAIHVYTAVDTLRWTHCGDVDTAHCCPLQVIKNIKMKIKYCSRYDWKVVPQQLITIGWQQPNRQGRNKIVKQADSVLTGLLYNFSQSHARCQILRARIKTLRSLSKHIWFSLTN